MSQQTKTQSQTNPELATASVELFDDALSSLAQTWKVDVESVDVSARVAAIIASEATVPATEQVEPVQIPAEFIPYLQERDLGEEVLTDFSGVPVQSLNSDIPILTPEQEQRLARAVEQGYSWGEIVLLSQNRRLVSAIAKKYADRGAEEEALIRHGMYGLEKAIHHFDHRRGFRFATYATHWIRQEMTRLVASRTLDAREPPRSVSDKSQVPSEFVDYLSEDREDKPPLTAEQEKRIGEAIEQGNKPWAQTVLIRANQQLVLSIAKEHRNRGVGLDELIREGSVGLTRAVDRFDYRRGFRFPAFATHWIRQAMQQRISSHANPSSAGSVSPERAARMGIPFLDLATHIPEPDALSALSPAIALKYRALPVKRDGNRLWVAMQNARDIDAVDAVRMATRCLVQPIAANPEELEKALTDAYGSLEPPQPPHPPTAIAAPAPEEPRDDTSQLIRETLSELRGLRDELASLRSEVAELRRDRSVPVPRPSTARLFPFAPESAGHRNR